MKRIGTASGFACIVVALFLVSRAGMGESPEAGRGIAPPTSVASAGATIQDRGIERGSDPAKPPAVQSGTSGHAVDHGRIASSYGVLPLRFEPNEGQAPSNVRFLTHDAGYSIALTDDAAILGLAPTQSIHPGSHGSRAESTSSAAPTLRIGLVHANPHPQLLAEQRQSSVSNYFLGREPSQWHRDVANFAAVRYRQVYPGIDWVLYGNPRRLEYDLDVAPHADPGAIRFDFAQAHSVALDGGGDLLINVGGRTIRQLKPVVYQATASGRKQFVEAAYVVEGRQVALAIGGYDRDRALVVDPVIAYSTYLGF